MGALQAKQGRVEAWAMIGGACKNGDGFPYPGLMRE